MAALIAALLLFLLPLAYSPGPGNLFFAAIGARFGTRASLGASAGYHVATFLITILIGLGFAEIMQRVPQVFTVLKYAGSAYVILLAISFLRAGVLQGGAEARPASFGDGVALLLLNPKAYVIIALMFTQFLSPDAGNFLPLLLVIAVVFTLNNLVAFTAWTMLGDALGRLFRSERNARFLNLGFAALLFAVGLWMLMK